MGVRAAPAKLFAELRYASGAINSLQLNEVLARKSPGSAHKTAITARKQVISARKVLILARNQKIPRAKFYLVHKVKDSSCNNQNQKEKRPSRSRSLLNSSITHISRGSFCTFCRCRSDMRHFGRYPQILPSASFLLRRLL